MAPRDGGDGLGMAPRPGEPESALLPGMAAPRPPAAQIRPVERFGLFGHVQLGSMPDTSGPGPTALETPVTWAYDFDPASGNARAQFFGIVLLNGSPLAPGGVSSFNTRIGAITLLQADVSAVAVGSFNGRTGAVALTQADLVAAGPIVRNSLSGFIHSSPGGVQTLTVGAGQCANSTNASTIAMAAATTKSLAAPWAAGSGNGGMGTGVTLAAGTWYFPFAMINAGAADIFFDTDPAGSHAPAGTTALRRLRGIKTDGASNVLAHIANGDKIQWVAAIAEGNSGTVTLIGVPPGIVTTAILQMAFSSGGGAGFMGITTPGAALGNQLGLASSSTGSNIVLVDTNAANQVLVSFTGTATGNTVTTMGFIDDCGRYN